MITMGFYELIKTVRRFHNKTSIWELLILSLSIIILLCIIHKRVTPVYEGFGQIEKYKLYKNVEKYDNFYTSLYDSLFVNTNKYNYEIDNIIQKTNIGDKSLILDTGSKTGDYVQLFKKKGCENTIGIDKCPEMVKKAKDKYPGLDFRVADPNVSMSLPRESLTHITCLNFTIYTMQDKSLFLQNCYQWLKPGGFLILNLVNRNKFDNGNNEDPIKLTSIQNYNKNQNKESFVQFSNFNYKSKFVPVDENNIAYFDEKITDKKTNNVRQHKETLYMPTQKDILSIAKNVGFLLHSKVDMKECSNNYHYLYILKKPE